MGNHEVVRVFDFNKKTVHCSLHHDTYRMEGNFDSGKIWRIHCMNTLAEENFANCEILQVKISRQTYFVKHSEHLRHTTNL